MTSLENSSDPYKDLFSIVTTISLLVGLRDSKLDSVGFYYHAIHRGRVVLCHQVLGISSMVLVSIL